MGRNKNNKHVSTTIRDNKVHEAYEELKNELGVLIYEVRREYIYGRIKSKVGLCNKCIAYILNHTRMEEVR